MPAAPRVIARRDDPTRFVTWATARRHGAVAHPELFVTAPGNFIVIRHGVGRLMNTAAATEAFLNGDENIIMPRIGGFPVVVTWRSEGSGGGTWVLLAARRAADPVVHTESERP